MEDEQRIDGLKVRIQRTIGAEPAEIQSAALCAALAEDAQRHASIDYISNRYARLMQELLSLMARHEHQQLYEHQQLCEDADRAKALHDAFTAITTWRKKAS